jgi:serine/threonine protein kinase
MVRGLPYSHEVDWWALGVMMYQMLTGRLPFRDADRRMLREKIKYYEVEYPQGVSKVAKRIMRKVSVINSMIVALKYYRVGLLYVVLFPGHVLFSDVKIFLWLCF